MRKVHIQRFSTGSIIIAVILAILVAEAFQIDDNALPAELVSITLTSEDLRLDTSDKLKKARTMVSDNKYENLKTQITGNVNLCMNELVDLTHSRQEKASAVFERLYWAQELGCFLLLLFLLINSAMIRKLIVRPLICYNKHIAKDELIPPGGAAELQALAETYNNVFKKIWKRRNSSGMRRNMTQ